MNPAERTRQLTELAALYLDLIKNYLTRLAIGEAHLIDWTGAYWRRGR